MIQHGTERLEAKDEVDFFAIFGEKEASGAKASMSHAIRGLGIKA